MPALKICGQRTCIAGDELFVPSILFIAMRLLQLAVLIPLSVFMAQDSSNDVVGCPEARPSVVEKGDKLALSYVVVSYILVIVGLIIEVGILFSSRQGTPTQPEKRRQVQRLCCWKLIPLSLLRIAAITLGLIVLSIIGDYCKCDDETDTQLVLENECLNMDVSSVCFKILIGTHLVEACAVAVIALYFGLKCTPSTPSLMSTQRKWQFCCQCFITTSSIITCCCFGGREVADFSDISIALEDYFDDGGTLDIVPSDIMVGLLMLLRVQTQLKEECRDELLLKANKYKEDNEEEIVEHKSTEEGNDSIDPELAKLALGNQHLAHSRSLVYPIHRSDDSLHYVAEARSVLLPKNVGDKIAISEGAHFMRYAKAMYTYKTDFLETPFKAVVVFGYSLVKSLGKGKNDNVEGDNWFRAHEASLERWTGLESEQVAHASFSEGIGRVPYCIAIDHEWKSVVIAIRGTQALEDLITDMTLRPESMEECGTRCGFDGRDCYAHAGMLENSQWIYKELERHGVLDKLLLEEGSPFSGYKLIVTGHSLGAGCAAVLSFMLRSKYPDLKCLCFSPPGCTLSENMAESCREYLTSYVLDDDIIPRLSLQSMEHLRDDVLEMIARIKVTKLQALYAKRSYSADTNGTILHTRDSIPPCKFSEQLAEFRAHNKKKKEESPMLDVPLYPPGKIVHLVKTGEKRSCRLSCKTDGHDNPYTASWVAASDLSEVIISSHLLNDHDPLNVLNELERIADTFGLSPPFTIPVSEHVDS